MSPDPFGFACLSTVTLEEAAGVALGAVIGEAENLRNVRLVLFGEEDPRVSREGALGASVRACG
jgi:hypothetical protein